MKRHIGAICDPTPSHVMNIAAIGRVLQGRGHTFTIFQSSEAEPYADDVPFCVIPATESNRPNRTESLSKLSSQRRLAVKQTNEFLSRSVRFICEGAPELVRRAGVHLLLADQAEPAASVVADALRIPFVTICNAVPQNRDDTVPMSFVPWDYRQNSIAYLRNRLGYKLRDWMISPSFKVLNSYRIRSGLPPYTTLDDAFSKLAQISQIVAEFDLPYTRLPGCFHYAGPFQSGPPRAPSFDWNWLDGRPLIYVSLGTVLGGRSEILRTIEESCRSFNAQTVVALGGGGSVDDHSAPSRDILFVSYAPQRELLKRAHLAIHHAGLNTVLEALACGVPSLGIPMISDQPGVGARIRYHKVGECLRPEDCKLPTVKAKIERLFRDEVCRARALRFKSIMASYRGSEAAADVIEQVLETNQPVYRVGC